MKKLLIFSDGTGNGTVVSDEEGNKLSGITEVSIIISANDFARATLEVGAVPVTVEAVLENVTAVCPCCYSSFEHICGDGTLGQSIPEAP